MSIWNETLIRARLDFDDRWVCHALKTLYERQTADEQDSGATRHVNGMGFSSVDGYFMSSLARQYIEKGWLSKKQIEAARRADIGKYWKQILEVIKANERIKEEAKV